jgi:cardiolipin synthase
LISDRKVAFTGGVGIADEWDGNAENPSQWRDTHFKIQGPAVSSILSGFIENWLECGRRITEIHDFQLTTSDEHTGNSAIQVIRSPASYGWTDFATALRLILSIAKKRLNITSAYFNPDETASRLLQDASRRGVEVNVLVPGRYTDKKIAKIAGEKNYTELLKAGIQIMHYQQTMMHAKIFSVDGQFACIGSPNFNQRSMRKDDELGLIVFDPEVVEKLDAHFLIDTQKAVSVNLHNWEKRGLRKKFAEVLVTQFKKEI